MSVSASGGGVAAVPLLLLLLLLLLLRLELLPEAWPLPLRGMVRCVRVLFVCSGCRSEVLRSNGGGDDSSVSSE